MATASRRLWLTTDGDIVEDGDKRAAFLLAGEGCEIPDGYTEPTLKHTAKAVDPDPDAKASRKPK